MNRSLDSNRKKQDSNRDDKGVPAGNQNQLIEEEKVGAQAEPIMVRAQPDIRENSADSNGSSDEEEKEP